MSFRKDRYLSLITHLEGQDQVDDLKSLYIEKLSGGIHGLCFSPYEEGQKPGDQLTEKQVRRRLEIIQPYTNWVRSFSTTEGNELIPIIAKELGMKTLVGAWLGKDDLINKKEIAGLVKLANDGHVDIAAVGNEVLYRKDLTQQALLDFINSAKAQISNVPIGYVDAYYEFELHPEIAASCDVLLANCYPFWEGCPREYALLYMKDMYRRAVKAANGKPVIITETGWPDAGTTLHGAIPSRENAMRYFVDTQSWSLEDDIKIFYFSSFDESWKTGAEGDVGAYWGIWDKEEIFKFK